MKLQTWGLICTLSPGLCHTYKCKGYTACLQIRHHAGPDSYSNTTILFYVRTTPTDVNMNEYMYAYRLTIWRHAIITNTAAARLHSAVCIFPSSYVSVIQHRHSGAQPCCTYRCMQTVNPYAHTASHTLCLMERPRPSVMRSCSSGFTFKGYKQFLMQRNPQLMITYVRVCTMACNSNLSFAYLCRLIQS